MNPSRIAERVRRIKPSPSTSAADRANELRRQGKSIVNLVVGEPDFDTPPHIRQAAAACHGKGATRYTLMAGTVELRQAIVAKLERENGLGYVSTRSSPPAAPRARSTARSRSRWSRATR